MIHPKHLDANVRNMIEIAVLSVVSVWTTSEFPLAMKEMERSAPSFQMWDDIDMFCQKNILGSEAPSRGGRLP